MKERSLSEKVTGIQRMSDSSQVTKGTEYIVGRGNNMSQGLGPHKLLMKQCFDIKLYVLFFPISFSSIDHIVKQNPGLSK
jgi:hypothetical protein